MEQQPELLRQFARGDLAAFEELFRQYQRLVFGWIVRIVRDPGMAEDLTVETFWRIYQARARFDVKQNFAPWARRIAMNAALDYLKKPRREVELTQDFPVREGCDPGVRQDVARRVRQAFEALPPKLRITAMLALVEEEPYQQIADALGISLSAVKLRVFRAVRQLRRELTRLGVEHE